MHRRVGGLALILMCACGGGRGHAEPVLHAGSRPEDPLPTTPETPETPVAFVEMLLGLVHGESTASVRDYYDHEFVRRLPSEGELVDLLGASREGCERVLHREGGYVHVAIPPPMTGDSEEEVRRIEGIIEVLRESVEVVAQCTVSRTRVEIDEDGESIEEVEEVLMLFAVAIRRSERGWRVLAWRGFEERPATWQEDLPERLEAIERSQVFRREHRGAVPTALGLTIRVRDD